ncbi:MAG: DUF4296 domain-containing protein [Bacteroidota bacterium]|jgi:hypothetical protein
MTSLFISRLKEIAGLRPQYKLYTLLILFSVGCNRPDFGSVMSTDEMKRVMWDMMKADELNNLQSIKDTNFAAKKMNFAYYEQVLKIHSLSREEFYHSLRYYQTHPPLMKELIDSIDQFSARERNKLFQPDVRYGNGFGSPGSQPK